MSEVGFERFEPDEGFSEGAMFLAGRIDGPDSPVGLDDLREIADEIGLPRRLVRRVHSAIAQRDSPLEYYKKRFPDWQLPIVGSRLPEGMSSNYRTREDALDPAAGAQVRAADFVKLAIKIEEDIEKSGKPRSQQVKTIIAVGGVVAALAGIEWKRRSK